MPRLSEFIAECKKYNVDSIKKDGSFLRNRDTKFSQEQRKIVTEIINKIEKNIYDHKAIRESVNVGFDAIKKLFLDMYCDAPESKKGKGIVSYSPIWDGSREEIEKQVDNGKGTGCVQLIYRFKEALKQEDFEFDFGKVHEIPAGRDPFRAGEGYSVKL